MSLSRLEKVKTYHPNEDPCNLPYNSEFPYKSKKKHLKQNPGLKNVGCLKNISPTVIRSWHFGGPNKILEETILGKILPADCDVEQTTPIYNL